MIELTLKIDSINYGDLAELLFPMLADQLPKDGLAGRLLRDPGRAQAMVTELLGRMSQQQKDELLIKYINRSGGKAAARLEELAAQHGVGIKIRDISAKTL